MKPGRITLLTDEINPRPTIWYGWLLGEPTVVQATINPISGSTIPRAQLPCCEALELLILKLSKEMNFLQQLPPKLPKPTWTRDAGQGALHHSWVFEHEYGITFHLNIQIDVNPPIHCRYHLDEDIHNELLPKKISAELRQQAMFDLIAQLKGYNDEWI